ncbi:MAG: hypothetical protein IPP07_22980 [Holophagales bacterium]|jgi:hypothetical protein|nr:hypothetical protein [Holophagales bacterium]MBK9967580.1 hypothetical protein [Holophagales bacterium]
MKTFRTLLLAAWALLAVYTVLVIADHGWGLFGVFLGDLRSMGWPGQFNLDFTLLLALSASWVAWRHRFSVPGLLLGLTAFFGGALFLTAYLFGASLVAKGDVKELLLGRR